MLTDILARQRRNGYRGISGATIKGRIPVRESLINEAVQDAMAKQGGSGSFVLHKISVVDNNIVIINATVKKWLFTQTLNLELAIDPIIDFPRDPVVRARPARSLGLLGVLAEVFATAFPLPSYASFASQTISVNLKGALESAGYSDLVPLVQYIGVTTRTGVLYIDFRLAVP